MFNVISDPSEYRYPDEPSVICLGNFDGVHLGHQHVIQTMLRLAKEQSARSVLVTFDPHPGLVLNPAHKPFLLTSLGQRLELFREMGVDTCCVLPFSESFARLTANQFLDTVLWNGFSDIRAVVVGFNFHFGYQRQGTPQFLVDEGTKRGVNVCLVQPFKLSGQVVSSTEVRRYIQLGHLVAAQRLLGRFVTIWGEVIHGDGRGAGLGFPTANLKTSQEILPPLGVYVVKAHVKDESFWGVMNVGYRPTFVDANAPTAAVFEVHLFDFSGCLYGCELSVDVHYKLRDECKFSSADELAAQIAVDCKEAKAWIGS